MQNSYNGCGGRTSQLANSTMDLGAGSTGNKPVIKCTTGAPYWVGNCVWVPFSCTSDGVEFMRGEFPGPCYKGYTFGVINQ